MKIWKSKWLGAWLKEWASFQKLNHNHICLQEPQILLQKTAWLPIRRRGKTVMRFKDENSTSLFLFEFWNEGGTAYIVRHQEGP